METLPRRCNRLFLLLLLLPLTWQAACTDPSTGAGAGPSPAARGLDAEGRMQIGPEDRCPVCAMPVADHERFSAALAIDDGTAFYFCSAGCMLRAWLHPELHLNRTRDRLLRPVARDYFTGRFIDARRAWWISGSDVIGPMGPALVALAAESDAAAFRRRHGAAQVFRLSELHPGNWKTLTGKRGER